MRSIRRSLLGYFLLLLALALGAVAVFVDRFAVEAIQAREKAEADRTTQAFEARRLEAQGKFDEELLREARSLAGELNRALNRAIGRFPSTRGPGGSGPPPKQPPDPPVKLPEPKLPAFPGKAPDKDAAEYLARVTALVLRPPTPTVLPTAATVAAATRPWNGLWVGFESPRTAARVDFPEIIRGLFTEGEHVGYYQFTVVAVQPGRPWQHLGNVRPPRLAQDLPLELEKLGEPGFEALPADDVEIPGQGAFRRVVAGTMVAAGGSRPVNLPMWLDVQTYTATPGMGRAIPVYVQRQGEPPNRSFRTAPDFWVRVFVHAARPRAELDARLAADAAARDEELQKVHRETREALGELRSQLAMIGAGSFLALVIGGWVIVARGLAPVRTLSDAVSRVSERDFSLPVDKADLSVELAPIHARITQTLDMLRAAFTREKEAVADISHELRTPIASLLATIDVSLRKPRTPDQYRTTLEDCRGIAKQLGQLVERIMTLASIDAGNVRGTVSRVDAAELAGGCATVIRPLAEAHGLSFSLSAVGPAELDTDPDRLREVLMNFLHNAVEYNRPAGRVELGVRGGDGRVVLEVRDTGIGMTDDVKAKIFERFYRADASRTATGVHAGLGLAIVKEYVDHLGGTINVESTPGEGSLFRVTFPAAPAAQP
jgi:two-component system heavy metal sensor histidine kinase CusS